MSSINVLKDSGDFQSEDFMIATPASGLSFEEDYSIGEIMRPLMRLLSSWAAFKKNFYQPRTNSLWFDGLGKVCKKIKEGSASWKALDLLYNHQFKKARNLSGLIDNFWLRSLNAQAVRNRRQIATKEIKNAVLLQHRQEVRLLAIATGSAQSEIEAISQLKRDFDIRVECLLVDRDQEALGYAKQLANRFGISDQVVTRRAIFGGKGFSEILESFQPDVVEMIGLLDYLGDDFAVRNFSGIRGALPDGGVFITGNICPNPEQQFLEHVLNWRMIYRQPQHLRRIMISSGFDPELIQTLLEPHTIHAVVVCQKQI